MTTLILDGKKASSQILSRLQQTLDSKKKTRDPQLCIVQVGDDPASKIYIQQKENRCKEFGILSKHVSLPRSSSFESIQKELIRLRSDPKIDGILLQLPLATDIPMSLDDSQKLIECIGPDKDADGLTILNQGRLFCGESTPIKKKLPMDWVAPVPATALGVYRLLEEYKIPLLGKRITVVGKSRSVGMPTATLLSHAGATVTICHSKTTDLSEALKRAEIIVACAGVPELIKASQITKGVVLIDVGIHRRADGKLGGDIHPDCLELASAYSPVPGGVGPMTVGSLLENLLELYRRHPH
jgi:methylenetetrahydrofolate dehydrogenase (NADP+)/methenyltetrahydrofolate cyclohydrolase